MPIDEWTGTGPGGELVHYTYEFEPETGGVVTKTKGDFKDTLAITAPMTREQVEAALRDA